MVLLSTLLTGGTLAVTASSASADPTGCTIVNGGNFAESRCAGGTGQHRVVMRQQHFDPNVGVIACPGPWVPVGLVSRAACGFQQVLTIVVETRPDSGPPPSGGPMDNPAPLPQPDMIPVPVPPGMNPPVPVRCFSQLFQDLIVRTRDNASAYVFFVDIVVCNNTSGSFVAVPTFSAFIQQFEPPLEEVVSIEVILKRQTQLTPTAISLEAKVKLVACLSPCRTFIHDFVGIANDRRGAVGSFDFTELV